MSTVTLNIDLSSLMIEDEEQLGMSIAEALREEIIRDARHQIRSMVRDRVDELARSMAGEELDRVVPEMVSERVASIHETKAFKEKYGSETDLDALVIKRLEFHRWSEELPVYIDKVTKKYSEEIKQRYDSRFAAGVVEGLNRNGLLNEGAAKLLINNEGQEGK